MNLICPKQIISCHPSNLPPSESCVLPRSPEWFAWPLGFSAALFDANSTFDGPMILFEDVIQVLHRSVSTTIAQNPFLLFVVATPQAKP